MDGSFFSKFWLRISADAPVIACRATQRASAGVPTTARAWAELMGRLEYKHYVGQGGDWGSVVADVMARGASILHHRTPTVRCRKNDTIAPSSLCRHARVVRRAGDVSGWLWVRHYRGRSDAGSRKCSRFPAPDHYDG